MTLTLEDVTCHHGSRRILHDITMSLGAGCLTAFVGPNGAGKSTLLATMSGDLRPSSGQVRLDGRDIGSWPPAELARRRSVLLQAQEVAFGFTAREVVSMGRHPWARTPEAMQDTARIEEALAQAEVTHLADQPVSTLSGGERARVGLARVLAQHTDIVLLDEPTAALDLRHQEDVMHRAMILARSGRTVAVVLHDLALAAAYADDVAVIDGGRLIAQGPPGEILTQQTIEEVYRLGVDRVETPDGRTAFIPRRPHLTKEPS